MKGGVHEDILLAYGFRTTLGAWPPFVSKLFTRNYSNLARLASGIGDSERLN
jgi:hypothetical protein